MSPKKRRRKRKSVTLPEKGVPKEEIFKELKELKEQDVDWKSGKCFAYVYYYTDEHEEVIQKAHNMYFPTNALSPLAFPSLAKFESEIVSMAADLFHGNYKTCGNVTSGGTESILMAIKTYRDYYRKRKPEIKKPEVILPESVHAAFNKACHYFDVVPVYIPAGEETNWKADVDAFEAAINENTILGVGSACEFPRGGVDPIKKMAAIAKKNRISFHVDSCLGGYMLPFLEELGYEIPEFDFRVPGVTSMSADIHKYGMTPKGSSTLLYKRERIWKNQFHAYTEWMGGVYASPTMSGTRPGSIIAGAWAGMKQMGMDGYLQMAKQTKEATDKLIKEIDAKPELEVLGDPVMTVFSFRSVDDELEIFALGDVLKKKGWMLDKLQFPKALHCIVVPHQAEVVDDFLEVLDESIDYTKKHPELAQKGDAAMYGMMATLEKRDSLDRMVNGFLADQYKSR